MEPTIVDVLVLNYNGRDLLAECLPSIVRAAATSRFECRVKIIDNASTDDSCAWLAQHHPEVEIVRCANEGLCSFNGVLATSDARVALLLNSDIKLAADSIDPLVEPLLTDTACFMTAPRCWLFDGRTYEGFKTAVMWRWGLVQATWQYPGYETSIHRADLTASAGAALAVDRARFVALGGFDPLYLPGRLEDLDLCYRAYQAGWVCRYVPESVAWHRGQATFGREYGSAGCDRLALRNTLLFQWKHLRHPLHRARRSVGLAARMIYDLLRAPWQPAGERFALAGAWMAARRRWRQQPPADVPTASAARERWYFRRFAPARMVLPSASNTAIAAEERRRAANYPLSRWYLRPLAGWIAARCAGSSLRPWQLTLAGLCCAIAAGAVLLAHPGGSLFAAALVLLMWLFDRADGQLARRQGTASRFGAWLDANVDEATDLGLHVAVAAAAASTTSSAWPWMLLIAWLVGKYLLMYGLAVEELPHEEHDGAAATLPTHHSGRLAWLRHLYHLPANADVRVHLLIVCVAGGWLTTELACIALYYNARWMLRYALVAQRSKSAWPGGAT